MILLPGIFSGSCDAVYKNCQKHLNI